MKIPIISVESTMLLGFPATVLAQLVLAWVLRKPWRRSAYSSLRELTPVEIASLTGGPEAAVDATLVWLVARDLLLVREHVFEVSGAESSTASGESTLTNGDRVILDAVKSAEAQGKPIGLRDLRALATDIFGSSRPSLVRAGCMLGTAEYRVARVLVALPGIALGIFSALEFAVSRDGPYVTVFVVGCLLAFMGLRLSPISSAGERALVQLRDANAALREHLDAEGAPHDIAIGFALFGPSALPAHLGKLKANIEALGSRIRAPLSPGERLAPAMRARW